MDETNQNQFFLYLNGKYHFPFLIQGKQWLVFLLTYFGKQNLKIEDEEEEFPENRIFLLLSYTRRDVYIEQWFSTFLLSRHNFRIFEYITVAFSEFRGTLKCRGTLVENHWYRVIQNKEYILLLLFCCDISKLKINRKTYNNDP